MSDTQSYSPFHNYFGLADLITSTTRTAPLTPLNPLAATFVPSSDLTSQLQESSSSEESDSALSSLPSSIQYKLDVQRQRAALKSDQYSRVRFCVFCQKSKKSLPIQKSHRLRDNTGRVVCPFLRQTVCSQCGATGDDAHTLKYCPANQPTLIFT